ncbi:MAG: HlyD family efflux transporter periplasmic adaptor subunit [Bacteroidia bacterium]|nr:HlyD family efflux transporter periplasmic adaptor subunit [Bacteroidia bacterium]
MKTIKFSLIIATLLILVSCAGNGNDFDATGSFEATEIIVSSQANGKILQLNVQEGQQVQANEIVGQIDSTQLYFQKMNLLSNAQGVRAQRPNIHEQTAAIEQQIQTLQRERTRTQNLIAANAANQKQLDDINSQIDVLQKQLSAQTSTLQKSSANISAQSSALQIQVAQLDDLLEKSTIKSPISGVVLNKYAEAGELAGTGTPLFKVADVDNMFLRAYITNDQLSKIKLNHSVTVRVDEGGGKMKSYPGTISWISDKAEFTPKTIQTKNERANLVYAVKIAVKNDGFLKIGMYGEVVF